MIETVRKLADIYPRLVEETSLISKGKSADNANGRTPNRDPRRAPADMETLDVLDTIEREIPGLVGWLCDACGWVNCLAPSGIFHRGHRVPNPAVRQAFATLVHYWPLLEGYARETAEALHGRCSLLLHRAERTLGDVAPPVALSAVCPSCREPSVFRVDTGTGWRAVCSNPADAPEGRKRREWTETEWEDANHPVRSVYVG